jgi:ketosteroid isomerase-like protein
MKMKLLLTALLVAAVAQLSGQPSDRPSPVMTVQMCIKGIETGDLDLIGSTFAEDAVVFFPSVSAARVSGKAAIRQAFGEIIGPSGAGKISPRDIVVQEFGDVAIVTAHLKDLPAAPILTPIVFPRRTFVLRYADGRWSIVHLHASNFQLAPAAAPKPESK